MRLAGLLLFAPLLAACSGSGTPEVSGPCALPGSILFYNGTAHEHASDKPGADLSFLTLPDGFCAHYYGTVNDARQLRFAPGGELFVSSPTTHTTGGGPGGHAAILALPDDDHDGYADKEITFMPDLPSTQGMLFANEHFYYQDGTKIRRIPYKSGDRAPNGASEVVADITVYTSTLHWPKTLDMADDGTIYVGNGGDQGETCDTSRPFHGGVLSLDGSPGGKEVAKGFRNPIAIRCAHGHDECFAVELNLDVLAEGREKIVPIRQGDDWGFPCCVSTNVPFSGQGSPNCSAIAKETDSFRIGNTPFGLAFEESGKWPAPWGGQAFVALHGNSGSWGGERVLAIGMDRQTGLLEAASTLNNDIQGSITDFGTGWDDDTFSHGRPAPLEFAPDGRLFIGNDVTGVIFWVAPLAL